MVPCRDKKFTDVHAVNLIGSYSYHAHLNNSSGSYTRIPSSGSSCFVTSARQDEDHTESVLGSSVDPFHCGFDSVNGTLGDDSLQCRADGSGGDLVILYPSS